MTRAAKLLERLLTIQEQEDEEEVDNDEEDEEEEDEDEDEDDEDEENGDPNPFSKENRNPDGSLKVGSKIPINDKNKRR